MCFPFFKDTDSCFDPMGRASYPRPCGGLRLGGGGGVGGTVEGLLFRCQLSTFHLFSFVGSHLVNFAVLTIC